MKYLDEFLKLRCAPDVLSAVGKINKPAKEITEAMGILYAIRSQVLKREPHTTIVFDLCAGNCLTGLLIAHVLPVEVVAVDKRVSGGRGKRSERWKHVQSDIFGNTMDVWHEAHKDNEKAKIIVASHPCGKLSERCGELASMADFGAIIPCCIGKMNSNPTLPVFASHKLTKYERWCFQICENHNMAGKRDNHIFSPCNIVLTTKSKR